MWEKSVEAKYSPKAINELSNRLYQALAMHSYSFFSNNFSGSLVRKVQRTGMAFGTIVSILLYNGLQLVITIIVAVVLTYAKSPALSAVFIVWLALIFVFNYFFAKRFQVLREKRAKADSEATGALSDAITNSTNVLLFNGFEHERGLIDSTLFKLAGLRTRVWTYGVWSWQIQGIFIWVVEVIALLFLFSGWKAGRYSVGDFALVQLIIIQLANAVWSVGQSFRDWMEATADCKEMLDIINTPYEIVDVPGAKVLNATAGEIVFNKVKFNYNETRTVLPDFSLNIKPGEKIALVGSSGAGKSTIVKLLFRFYDVTAGKILIDGQNIAKVTQESLRNAISLVPQDPLLFHRSLMDNIRYGRRDATDEEVYAAAKKAHCHEFISALSDGYKTFVGERGIKLSGGERQRVAIARAILKNAPILVLDEATSSLDSESEMLIQQALEELMRDKTVIVIAHRLSTIAKMDRIIVMENGKIIDQGTHASLIKKRGGVYKKLWSIQAGGFIAEPEAI